MLRDALDARLTRLRAKYGLPGVSAAIMFADGSIWRGTDGDADVATGVPGHARHLVLGRQRLEDVHRRAHPRARRGRPAVARRLGQGLPAVAADRPGDHGPRAARPHERPARLLLRGGRRPRPAQQAGARLGPRALVQVRRQAVLEAGRRVALLEHELPRPRDAGRGGRRRARRGPAPRPVLRRRSDSTTRSTRCPASRGPARSRTAIGSSARTRRCPPSTCRTARAIVPFTSVVTAAGGAGSIATSAGDLVALGAGAVRRRPPRPGHARRDGRRRRPDRAAQARRRRTASASRRSRSTVIRRSATPGGSSGARAVVRWLPRERIAIAVLTNQSRSDPNVVLASLLKLAFQPATRLPAPAPTSPDGPGARGTGMGVDPYQRRARSVPTGLGAVPVEWRRLGRPAGRGFMAIRVDAYTSGGMASGILARPGALRDALEDGGSLPLDGAGVAGPRRSGRFGRRLAGDRRATTSSSRSRTTIPGVPVHAAWHHIHLESGPYTVEGELATHAGLRSRARADPPVGRVPAPARRPPVDPRTSGGRRRHRRPRAGQSLRGRAHPGGPDARVLLPGRRGRRADGSN